MGTDIEPINLEDGTVYVETGDGRWQELKWMTEPLIAQTVTITGDTHDPDGGTPIYDQLLKEVATDE